MTDGIHVVTAGTVSNLMTNHQYTINDYGADVETFQFRQQPNQTTYPLPASNSQLTFPINIGSAAIEIQNSFIEINMLMTYHFGGPTDNVKAVVASTSAGYANVKRAWLTNGQWFEQVFQIQTDATASPAFSGIVPLGNPYRVAVGPVWAGNMFFQSNVNCGGLTNNTQRIWEKIWKYAVKQSADTCNTDGTTFFMASDNSWEKAAIQFDGIPYVMTSGVRTILAPLAAAATTWSPSLAQANIAPEFSVNFVSATQVDYCVSKNFTFRIPIQFLNDVFCMTKNPLFYLNAIRGQSLMFDLQFREFSLAQLFGNQVTGVALGTANIYSGIVDTIVTGGAGLGKFYSPMLDTLIGGTNGANSTTTNAVQNSYTPSTLATCMTNIQMWLTQKSSGLFTSDVQSLGIICEQVEAMVWQAMPQPSASSYSFQQTKSAKNIHDLMYIMNPKDVPGTAMVGGSIVTNSVYAVGLVSQFFAKDLVSILNGDMALVNPATTNAQLTQLVYNTGPSASVMVPYFYDMNLTLPPGSYDYVRNIGGIENLSHYKNLSLAAEHLLGNPFSGACPLFTDFYWKLLCQVLIIDVEKFKGKMHGMGDTIIADGIDTSMGGIITFRYNYLAAYDPEGNNKSAPVPYVTSPGSAVAMPYMKMGYPNLNFQCYYFTEQFVVIEPMSNKAQITQDIRPYINRMQ